MDAHTQPWITVLGWLWRAIRFPIVTLMIVLEPLVSIVFGGFALVGVLTVLFYKLIQFPRFPTWTVLSISIGAAMVLRLYRALILLLSR